MITQADLERRRPDPDRLAATPEGTSAGAVFARPGEREARPANGIDRWIGGVHLHGEAARWRWDEGTESIVSAGNFTLPG
jgi:hypothetical protein